MIECYTYGDEFAESPDGNPFCSDECEDSYEIDAMKVVY